METAIRRLRGTCLLFGLTLLAVLGGAMPAQAESEKKIPLACWFYKYQWAYFRMIHHVWPPTSYSTDGTGTGLMVTDGSPPSTAEIEAIITDIQHKLPRGDAEAPPPRAFIQSIGRMACPKDLNGMGLPLAKLWLHQPEVTPGSGEASGGSAPRRSK